MPGHVARRLLTTLPAFFGILLISFILTHRSGDPADLLLTPDTPDDVREEFRRRLGLDQPIRIQFYNFGIRAVQGDFGNPLRFNQPAVELVVERLVHGVRITLLIALLAVAVSGLTGTAAGLAAGYFGGRTDAVVLRLIDMQLAFPVILPVIAIVAVVGPSITNLIILMGISAWPRFARIVRGSVLSARMLEFVDAARSLGANNLRIVMLHILPNIKSAIIV